MICAWLRRLRSGGSSSSADTEPGTPTPPGEPVESSPPSPPAPGGPPTASAPELAPLSPAAGPSSDPGALALPPDEDSDEVPPYGAPLWRGDFPGWWADSIPLTPGDYARRHSTREGVRWAIDLGVSTGTPVRSPCDGLVAWVTPTADPMNGGGVAVTPDRSPAVLWLAIHLSEVRVAPGQRVARGQVIGLSGSTGNSTGPHLHLEVEWRPGDPALDPLDPALVDWRGAGWEP